MVLQRDRIALWAPIAFGAGALVRLMQPGAWEQGALAIACLALTLAAAAVRFWPSLVARPIVDGVRFVMALALAGGAFLAAGALAVDLRIDAVAATRLDRELGPVPVEGWVLAADPGARMTRFTILVKSVEGGPALRKVRISAADGPGPGRGVRCFAKLAPPQAPLAPRSFDAQRRAFFEGVGATGFAFGRCRPVWIGAPEDWRDRLTVQIAAHRRELTEWVARAAPSQGGAVAAALITGDQSLIDQTTLTALRDSGLGHLLSVSGLHMSIVAGMSFAAVLFACALIPGLALHAPLRKIAAATAIIVCGLYFILSGASVPAERAYIMTLVAFGAILADRPALSMRGLAIAALIVLALRPESVLEPGFQMSFAATGALIAVYESIAKRTGPDLPSPGLVVRGLRAIQVAIVADLITTITAGLATDPFVVYHFGRLSVYGAAANLAASPIVTLIAAPAAGIAAIAAPFGLADYPIAVMAWALDLLIGIGSVFANRAEAVTPLPLAPDAAFAAAVIGLLWAMLWRGWLRALALGPAIAAIVLMATAPRPIVWADEGLRVAYVRTDLAGGGGWRLFAPVRGGTFAKERLAGLAGLDPRRAVALPRPDGCAATDCTWSTPGGRTVAWALNATSVGFLCGRVDVILAPEGATAPRDCRAIIVQPAADGRGGYALWEDPRLRVVRGRQAAATANAPWAVPPARAVTDSAE